MDLADGEADAQVALPKEWREAAVPVSAIQRAGLDALGARLLRGVAYDAEELVRPAAFSTRQVAVLQNGVGAARKRFREYLQECLGARGAR
jgi:hypothetical protein